MHSSQSFRHVFLLILISGSLIGPFQTAPPNNFSEIKKVGIMDATRFKCVARNEAGVDSISYTVDVNIPPVIENVRNTEQIIIEGRAPRTNLNSSMKNPSGEP